MQSGNSIHIPRSMSEEPRKRKKQVALRGALIVLDSNGKIPFAAGAIYDLSSIHACTHQRDFA